MQLPVKLIHPAARPPERTRADDAAYDLRCCEDFELSPGQRLAVNTGVALAIPTGYCGLVIPRSGLAARHGLGVVNAPGLIDSEYRGEVQVICLNTGNVDFAAEAGDRIAQLLIIEHETPEVLITDELPTSADGRGAGGLGSSGRR